jgi:acetyltransferase
MVEFHRTVSEQSVYFRYFTPFRLEARIAHKRLARICHADQSTEIVLVAETEKQPAGPCKIIAICRLCKLSDVNAAEIAILVGDPWQHHGLGSRLLRMLIRVGRAKNLDRIFATILADNIEMRRLCENAGLKVESESGGEYHAEIELNPTRL